MNSIDAIQKEKTAQFLWTGIILSFFIVQAIIWIAAITLTATDTSHAVIADYDEKALSWDQQIAVRQASARLGWQTALSVEPHGDIRGIRTITLRILDTDQAPVIGAEVHLTAFHLGNAGDRQPIQFVETENGSYSARIRVRHFGIWQFEGAARRGPEILLINDRQFLTAAS